MEKNGFRLVSRLLIAFGILIINPVIFAFLGEIICYYLYHVKVSSYLISGIFDSPSANEINALRMWQGIVSIGTFIVSSFIIALIFKQKPTEYLGLATFPKPIFLFMVPVLLLVSMPFLSWLIEMNSKLSFPSFLAGLENYFKETSLKNEKMYHLMLNMDGYKQLFLNIIIMALIPAIGEELFCRGVLLNILYDYSGKFMRSIVIVAIIFTFFHQQIYTVIPMMLLAVILGLFINWTQSIWASILFHFLNNMIIVIGSFYYQRGVKNFITDEHAHIPYLFTILSFVITIALIAWLNKFAKQNTKLINE